MPAPKPRDAAASPASNQTVTTEESLGELSELLARGRVRGAAELLVRGETETLLALARALVVDEGVAEGAVLRGLEEALPALRDARRASSPRAWVAGAVSRAAARGLAELGAELFGAATAPMLTEPSELASEPLLCDPHSFRRALMRLTPGDRALLVLHHGAGWSDAECAAALGLPATSAAPRLSHARGALAAALDELALTDQSRDGPMTLPAPPPADDGSGPPRAPRLSIPLRPADPTLPDLGGAGDDWGEATAVRPPEWLSAARAALARDALGGALREHFGDPSPRLVTRLEATVRLLPA